MKHKRILALAILAAGVATPALADWDNIGSVFINHRPDRDSKRVELGGSVEKLSVRPESSDVMCKSIRVHFANGRTRTVFSGNLREDRSRAIDLPGGMRNINRIDFNCTSDNRRGTKLTIAADIGRYQSEWRQNPNWNKLWANMFAWGRVDDRSHDRDRDQRGSRDRDHQGRDYNRGGNMNDHRGNRGSQWVLLSNERFTGRRDREVLNGTKGITRLALRGSSDAVCRRISVKFGNGKDRDLSNIRLGSDRYAELDLPGARRDVRKISLTCQGVRSNDVVIGIYGLRS